MVSIRSSRGCVAGGRDDEELWPLRDGTGYGPAWERPFWGGLGGGCEGGA